LASSLSSASCILLLALSACAPVRRSETRTPQDVRARTVERCSWVPASQVRRAPEGVVVSAEEIEKCTTHVLEARSFRVKRVRHPDWAVLAVEGGLMLVGVGIFLVGAGQGTEDLGVRGAELEAAGVLVAVPAGIATAVDAASYHEETDHETETSDTQGLTREKARRPVAGVAVSLVFDDGQSIDARSDGDGKAVLAIPVERWGSSDAIEARLRIGSNERRIRLSRPADGAP
jgi:hypothetical protein